MTIIVKRRMNGGTPIFRVLAVNMEVIKVLDYFRSRVLGASPWLPQGPLRRFAAQFLIDQRTRLTARLDDLTLISRVVNGPLVLR